MGGGGGAACLFVFVFWHVDDYSLCYGLDPTASLQRGKISPLKFPLHQFNTSKQKDI